MMKKTFFNALLCLAAALALTACALPATKTISGGERPTLSVVGAPAGAVLIVDGNVVGNADRFDGTHNILTIEEGFHEVTVQQNGRVLRSEKIYVAPGETKRIEIGTPHETESDAGEPQ
jgi:hypothetical protein